MYMCVCIYIYIYLLLLISLLCEASPADRAAFSTRMGAWLCVGLRAIIAISSSY